MEGYVLRGAVFSCVLEYMIREKWVLGWRIRILSKQVKQLAELHFSSHNNIGRCMGCDTLTPLTPLWLMDKKKKRLWVSPMTIVTIYYPGDLKTSSTHKTSSRKKEEGDCFGHCHTCTLTSLIKYGDF